MAFSKSRWFTLLLALAFLASNLFSLALTHQLPDDPYNLARNYGWYLHLAGVVSVFGVIGCLREHAQSLLLFAHYLTLDTLLSSIPRLLLLTAFSLPPYTSSFCSPSHTTHASRFTTTLLTTNSQFPPPAARPALPIQVSPQPGSDWSPQACTRALHLFQLSIAAGVIAATVLQFVATLYVRSYALGLWREECEADAETQIEAEFGDAKAFEDPDSVEGNWVPSLETISEGEGEGEGEDDDSDDHRREIAPGVWELPGGFTMVEDGPRRSVPSGTRILPGGVRVPISAPKPRTLSPELRELVEEMDSMSHTRRLISPPPPPIPSPSGEVLPKDSRWVEYDDMHRYSVVLPPPRHHPSHFETSQNGFGLRPS